MKLTVGHLGGRWYTGRGPRAGGQHVEQRGDESPCRDTYERAEARDRSSFSGMHVISLLFILPLCCPPSTIWDNWFQVLEFGKKGV